MPDLELIEYLKALMPAAPIACAGCGVEREAEQAIIRSDQFFCSETCADRALAIMIKPQPKGVKLDGYDI